MNEKARQAIELVRQVAREAAGAGELPAFLGALEAVRVEAILEAARPTIEPRLERKPDRVLTVGADGGELGRSPRGFTKTKTACRSSGSARAATASRSAGWRIGFDDGHAVDAEQVRIRP